MGEPIGKIELKDEILCREDCQEGTVFYKQYLDPEKRVPHLDGLTG